MGRTNLCKEDRTAQQGDKFQPESEEVGPAQRGGVPEPTPHRASTEWHKRGAGQGGDGAEDIGIWKDEISEERETEAKKCRPV